MNISILLRHSGVWQSEIVYERYKSDGIVVAENITYVRLISGIAAELEIEESRKKMNIRYAVEGNSSSMVIRNDNGVKLRIVIGS